MKKIFRASALLLFVVLIAACSGKKSESQTSDNDTTTTAKANTPYANSSQTNDYTARLGGTDYVVTISRSADTSLPVVTDELGNKFYDNRVNVQVKRGAEQVLNKTFTKENFSEFLTSQSERQGTVLLGMAYDSEKSDGHTLRLGAQIGQVGIEEGPAFTVEIPLDGGAVSIVRDTNQDTTGNDGMTD